MSTFLYNYIESLEDSWREISILYEEANFHFEKTPDIYSALCRSISILIVAHLEGFLKELSKAIVKDLSIVSFSKLPKIIKRHHCSLFLGPDDKSKDYNNRSEALIKNLEQYQDYKISIDAFLHGNNNPKCSIIEKYAQSFGCYNVFMGLYGSSLEQYVFSCSNNFTLERIHRVLRWRLKKGTKNFPYDIEYNFLGISKKKSKEKSFWEDFIEKINSNRHRIVHGNDFSNHTNLNELLEDIWKTRIFQLAFIFLICQSIKIEKIDQ